MKSTEAALEHSAAKDQLFARETLKKLYAKSPLALDDELFNLGLFVRSGLLVKFLLLADLYRRFVNIPGALVEFGTWYGQNLILLENLRALLEPFNRQRRILGFDSFVGYDEGKFAGTGLYATGKGYIRYLEKLLDCHSKMNVYGHLPAMHELIEGDVGTTAPAYFQAHPELTVAFAFFDMGPYIPTVRALSAIKPHLVSGSIIVLDEFTLADTPGEATAFRQVFEYRNEYTIETHPLYRTKSIVTIR